MSLNGLAAPNIKEAHEKAASKPGGWFLLKYASRDEIELFSCGNGGTGEMRNMIARYKDASPLFGFLRYRRKNVIIKFIPEGCSRLVQARVTVHFNAITEHFSPYDMTLSMTSTKELRDTALSALCSLHTASGSTSSSTSSLHRRQLIEIAEEEEHNEEDEKEEESEEGEESRLKRESMASEISEGEPCTARAISISDSLATVSSKDLISSSRSLFWNSDVASSLPSPNGSKVRPSTSSHSDSTASGYPNSDNSTHTSVLNGRPKVRLGPRPSQDIGARPCALTSGCYRPISTLPAGLKSFAKGSREREKPKSTGDSANFSKISNSSIPTSLLKGPDLLKRPLSSSGRPTTSSGLSLRSIPSPTVSIKSKPHAADLARARLLRAQEMRKKKMEVSRSLYPEKNSISSDIRASEMTPPASPICGPKYEPHLTILNDIDRTENSSFSVEFDGTLIESETYPHANSNCITLQGPKLIEVSSTDNQTKRKTSKLSNDNQVTSIDLNLSYTMKRLDTTDNSEAGGSKSDLNMPEQGEPQSNSALCKPKENVSVRMLTNGVNSPSNDGASTLSLPGMENVMQSDSGFPEIKESTPRLGNLENPDFKKLEVSNVLTISSDDFALRTNLNNKEKPIVPLTPEKSPKGVKITNISPDSSKQNLLCIKIPTDETILYKETEDGDRLETIQASLKIRANTQTEIETTDLNVAESDCNSSSDNEFIDESQSAIIEDAKPVAVAKSHIGSISNLPNSYSKQDFYYTSPCVSSNPLLRDNSSKSQIAVKISPENSSLISRSAVTKRISSLPNLNIAKKSNLGSGISQRIKALEKLSTLSTDSDIPLGKTAGIPTFFPVRKSIFRTNSNVKLQSKSDGPNSSVRKNLNATNDVSLPTTRVQNLSNVSPKLESTSPSLSDFNSTTAPNEKDSSQDLSNEVENSGIGADFNVFNLQESTSKINRRKKEDSKGVEASHLSDSKKKLEGHAGNFNSNKNKERRSSLTVLKDLLNESRRSMSYENLGQSLTQNSPYHSLPVHISMDHNQDHLISNIRSSIGRDTGNIHSPSPSDNLFTGFFEDKNEANESRTSQVLDKSSSLSTGRKPISQAISFMDPEPLELNVPLNSEPKSSPLPENITIISDVNVQFPDSLLWKRKTMLLDSHGFLILAPVTSEYPHEISKDKQIIGVIRKFHMSELKKPYIPDLETEELPNSIMFDMNEGKILQIACQNRPAQSKILKILQDSYSYFTMNL